MTARRLPLSPPPPEDLQALCAISDVQWKPVRGRPANTWKLFAFNVGDGSEYARNLQTTDYEIWAECCKWLNIKRLGHTNRPL